jgi:hypothetical protein
VDEAPEDDGKGMKAKEWDRTANNSALFPCLHSFATPVGSCAITGSEALWAKRLLPTSVPTTVPKMAPATKSENQWIVMDTPIPT